MYRLNKNLKSVKLKYEVIFIDDNSQDGSFELFKKIKKNMKFYIRKENLKIYLNLFYMALKKQDLTT